MEWQITHQIGIDSNGAMVVEEPIVYVCSLSTAIEKYKREKGLSGEWVLKPISDNMVLLIKKKGSD